jgi:hypothetical protein
VRPAGYKGAVSYQPADASGAVLLAVQASRALAAAGQGDMVWGHVSIRDPDGRGAWMKAAGWAMTPGPGGPESAGGWLP